MFNVAGCQWQDTLSWIIGRLSVHSLLSSPSGGKTRRHRFFKTLHRRFQLKTSAFYSAVLFHSGNNTSGQKLKAESVRWTSISAVRFLVGLLDEILGGVVTRDFTTARHRGWAKQLFSPKVKKFILKWINDWKKTPHKSPSSDFISRLKYNFEERLCSFCNLDIEITENNSSSICSHCKLLWKKFSKIPLPPDFNGFHN